MRCLPGAFPGAPQLSVIRPRRGLSRLPALPEAEIAASPQNFARQEGKIVLLVPQGITS
jgi:hypothetical protein